jgi:hypothetical protein
MTLKFIIFIVVVFSFSSCIVGDTKCCKHVGSSSISNRLYLERYRTFCAGVFGELTECYLTDSTSFRQKIGSYDEHESFFAKLNGDRIEAYNFQSSLIADTIEKRTITKADLWKCHHSDTTCLRTIPIFGKNTIKCNKDFYPASSYKDDDGNFMAEVQYKCGNNFSNAVFYTDSLNFCAFIGVYIPGSFENNYSVKHNKNDSYDFFNITDIRKVDTVNVETYSLTDLKKGKLVTVCK